VQKLILLGAILIFSACQKKDAMRNDFPVFPASTFLKANDQVAFQFSAPGIQLVDAQAIGTVMSDREYQAPEAIEVTQRVHLKFKREKDRAQIPIYLLEANTSIFTYQNDWISLDLGDKVLESNVWGVNQSNQKINHLALTQFPIEEDQYIAWKWAATNQQAHTILAYPEIVFGWKPWRNTSTTSELPRPLNQIKSIPVKYQYEGSAKGSYNLAFDCWINAGTSISKENILTEVMVWEDWSNLNPVGQMKERLESPYGTYEVWEGTTTEGWNCLTFRKVPPASDGDIDLHWFLKYLIAKGVIQDTQILASVEFGNEIGKGTGVTIIKNYQIKIQ